LITQFQRQSLRTTVIAKKVKRRLADDIMLSLDEALKYVRGENADVIVRRVTPGAAAARPARHEAWPVAAFGEGVSSFLKPLNQA
jgi:hypothetical protein